MTATGPEEGGQRVDGLYKKEKGLMDMDNSVGIAGRRGVYGDQMIMGKKYNQD